MMLDTLTMRPACARRINGSSFWVSATVPKKFVSKVSRRISKERVLGGPLLIQQDLGTDSRAALILFTLSDVGANYNRVVTP